MRELRRRRGAGRLLRAVRHQAAERAGPLPRGPCALGRRGLRPGHPALPQRGRDGAAGPARRRASGPCWSCSTASPTPTTPTRRRWPAPAPLARCCARRSRAGWARRRAGSSAVTKVFADAVERRQRRRRSGHARRAPSTRRPRHSSPRSSRARYCPTPTSGTRGPTGFPTVRRACSSRVDDSAAQLQIEAGMSRLEAEAGPQGHAITRWLGRDAPDLAPRVGERTLDSAGWVLVCSDGLWNYASEPEALAAQLAAAGTTDPADARPGADRVRQRTGRTWTTSPSPWPGSTGRMPEHAPTDRAERAEGVRWLSSPPPSTRTSSFPTAAPTSTRS